MDSIIFSLINVILAKTLYADGVEDLIVTKIDEYFNVTLEDDSEVVSFLIMIFSMKLQEYWLSYIIHAQKAIILMLTNS